MREDSLGLHTSEMQEELMWSASSTNTIKRDSFKSKSSSGLNSLYTTFNIQEPNRNTTANPPRKPAVFTLDSLFGSSQNTFADDGASIGTDASSGNFETNSKRNSTHSVDSRRHKYKKYVAKDKKHKNVATASNSQSIQHLNAGGSKSTSRNYYSTVSLPKLQSGYDNDSTDNSVLDLPNDLQSRRRTFDNISVSTTYSNYNSAQYSTKWRVFIAVLVGGILIALCLLGFYLNVESRRSELRNYSARMGTCELERRTCPSGYKNNTVLLIAIDSLRSDMITRVDTPTLHYLSDCGVTAHHLTPMYPTTTFPNLNTIMTGLYPESHGIVGHYMFDPETGETFKKRRLGHDEKMWWNGQPLWITMKQKSQRRRSALYFWPGAEVDFDEGRPDYFYKYRSEDRLDLGVKTVLDWLLLEEFERPQFVGLYIDHLDQTAKKRGLESTKAALSDIDKQIDTLMTTLDSKNLTSCIDVVISSGHGVTSASSSTNSIFLEKFWDNSKHIKDGFVSGAVGRLKSKQNGKDLKKEIMDNLRCKTNQIRVLTSQNIPVRYHYSNNPRIEDIILDTCLGCRILSKSKGRELKKALAEQGYNNIERDMQGVFIARGPSFKTAEHVHGFRNVELYNLLTTLLDVDPVPNNGTTGSLHHILHHPPGLQSPIKKGWPEIIMPLLHEKVRDHSYRQQKKEEIEMEKAKTSTTSTTQSTTTSETTTPQSTSSSTTESTTPQSTSSTTTESTTLESIPSTTPESTTSATTVAQSTTESTTNSASTTATSESTAAVTPPTTISTSSSTEASTNVSSSTESDSNISPVTTEVVSIPSTTSATTLKQDLPASTSLTNSSQNIPAVTTEMPSTTVETSTAPSTEAASTSLTKTVVTEPVEDGKSTSATVAKSLLPASSSGEALETTTATNQQVSEAPVETAENVAVVETVPTNLSDEPVGSESDKKMAEESDVANDSVGDNNETHNQTLNTSEMQDDSESIVINNPENKDNENETDGTLVEKSPTADVADESDNMQIVPDKTVESKVDDSKPEETIPVVDDVKDDANKEIMSDDVPMDENKATGDDTQPKNRRKREVCECVSTDVMKGNNGASTTTSHINYHCPFGKPIFSPNINYTGSHYILPHSSHVTGYIGELGTSLWTSFTITNETVEEIEKESHSHEQPCWLADPRLPRPTEEQCSEYLKDDRYDNVDVTMKQLYPVELEFQKNLQSEGHFLSNAIALHKKFAEGCHKNFTGILKTLIKDRGLVNVIMGPVWDRNADGSGDSWVDIRSPRNYLLPSHVFYLVSYCTKPGNSDLADCPLDKLEVLTVIMPNINYQDNCFMTCQDYAKYHLASVADLQTVTNLQFFERFRNDVKRAPLIARQPLVLL